MSRQSKTPPPSGDHTIIDEPGMAERFQRGLQRAFQMPHKPHTPKAKTRPKKKADRANLCE
jgi:hypothetical protein